MWLSEEGIAIATNRTLRKLSANGNAVGTESSLVKLPFWEDRPVDIDMQTSGLLWHSPKTPTKEEILSGEQWLCNNATGVKTQLALNEQAVLYEDDAVLLFNLDVLLVVAYKTGEHTMLINGQQFTVNIPKQGIYLSKVYEYKDRYIALSFETTTPIDPKYLRKEIKLESYADGNGGNLAGYILDLFARGGGTTTITFIDNLWADLKANKEIRVTMPVQASVERAYTIATDSITRLWWTDNCIQLSINMMFMLDDGQLYNIFVTIVYQTNGNHLLIVRAA